MARHIVPGRGVHRHLFPTEAEAEAFWAGIEYANDDALTIAGIVPIPGPSSVIFSVVTLDDDDEEDSFGLTRAERKLAKEA